MKRIPTLATPNYILLLAAALLPRLMALGRYVTPDELAWVERSIGLRRALLAGDWAATIQSGHPGVTTSWLGAIGIQLQLWLQPASQASLDWLETLYWLSPDNQQALRQLSLFLSSGRLLVILTTSLGILLIYRLSQPLLGDGAALIGCLLLALDPFIAGLSGLLHLDALLATFALLAVLALLPGQPARHQYGLFAGVLTGLALLTKTPGLLLLLFLPGLLLWRWQIAPRLGTPGQIDGREMGRLLLTWLAGLAVTLLLLLPALWAAPTAVYEQVAGLSGRLLETAVRPIYYLGELTDNPGPSYYPVVVFLRLTPVTTVGLLLLAGAARRQRRLSGQAQTLLLLLAYSAAFLLMLTLAAKKYDRYALPAILPLFLAAASGWVWLGARWPRFRGLPDGFAALVATGQFLFLLLVLPFPLAAYNWLGGGVRVAERVMTVGWGEAVSTAAADLGQGLPAGVTLPTLFTDNVAAAAPFYPGPVARLTANNLRFARNGDSIVVEAASWQGGQPALLAERTADQYWQLRGLTARRYPIDGVSPLPRQLVGWSFGEAATVNQVEFAGAAWPERIPLALTLTLKQPADYQLLLALQDSRGHIWASWEQPLLNEFDQTGAFWLEGIPYRRRYDLAFPGDIPPGSYTLTASLFAANDRLGVFDGAGQFAGVSLPLTTLPISAPSAAYSPDIPQAVADGAYPGLAGFGTLPTVLDNGGSLSLDIWWTAGAPAGQLALLLGDTTLTTPFTTPSLPAGARYHLRPRWELPLDLTPGEQPLALQLQDEAGHPLWAAPFQLSSVTARQRDRLFELPADLAPLNLQFGELALLQGATAKVEGDQVVVELVWQARGPLEQDYFHFVHLRGADEAIFAQSDRSPAEPTSLWVAGQVVVDRVTLDRPVAGDYTITIGLYNPETGLRPPLFDSRGAPLSADQTDQYLLPLTIP